MQDAFYREVFRNGLDELVKVLRCLWIDLIVAIANLLHSHHQQKQQHNYRLYAEAVLSSSCHSLHQKRLARHLED